MKVLIISPHPDDMEIWMGGTVAKYVTEGCSIRSIILTAGQRTPRPGIISDEDMINLREHEIGVAHEVLGVKDFESFGLSNVTDPENDESVREIIRTELQGNYDKVYAPYLTDSHPTHRRIAEIVKLTADDLSISSEIWGYDGWNLLSDPDMYIDITDFVDQKVAAVKKYESQLAGKAYDEVAIMLPRVRAVLMDAHKLTDIKYAEAFKRF